MRQITVDLDQRSYPIIIDQGEIDRVGERLACISHSPLVFLVSNPTVYQLYGERVTASLQKAGFTVHSYLMPDGEQYKEWDQLKAVIDRAVQVGVERTTPLIALGGGVVGDLAGLAAALYNRGIPFIQIPTTLLAQVDSSVGGKVAVNHPLGKNLIGCFYQPRLVLADPRVLFTLPEREFRSGLAEVIKYGIIADSDFFSWLEANAGSVLQSDPQAWEYLIAVCCQIKAAITGADEREESGERMLLNLGHTFGHAVEALTGYTEHRHGEAVAMGTVCASQLAFSRGMIDRGEAQRISALLQAVGLPVKLPPLDPEQVLQTIARDKKVANGELKVVLPYGIGQARVVGGVQEEEIRAVIAACTGEV